MKFIRKITLYSLILGILFNTAISALLADGKDISPMITNIIQNGQDYSIKPMIVGLVPENSEVMVYLDGSYVGNANVNNEKTGTDNFYYQIDKFLNEGSHVATVVAKDKTSLRLSNVSNEYGFSINSLPAPTMIQPDENTITGKVKPFITGLTVNDTFVHVYIDGVYNGKTEILQHKSGTANFKYTPFLNLAPGWHTAWGRTEDKSGRISGVSNILNFRIENPNPAPTILSVATNNQTNSNQPFISGVAKNNSKVRVFIDKKLNGEFLVANNVSGTANFSYKPFLPLVPGRHMVYMTSVDARGKESIWSKIVYFNIGDGMEAQVEEGRGEEFVQKTDDADVKKEEIKNTDDEEVISSDNDKKDLPESDMNADEVNPDVKEILNPENKSTSTESKGLVDESQEQQGKLKMNVIIFIIFLFMVIAWIFWVNRELIKERREQNDKDKEDKDLL